MSKFILQYEGFGGIKERELSSKTKPTATKEGCRLLRKIRKKLSKFPQLRIRKARVLLVVAEGKSSKW